MKKILMSVLTVALVSAAVFGATRAYFSDTETSTGNTFTAGSLNLQIGESDPTTWTFSADNIKPGYNGNHDVDIKNTGSVDGDVSIDVAVSNSDEGATPESETETEAGNGGELDDQMRICIYMQEDQGVGGFDNVTCGFANVLNGTTIDIPADKDAWINDDTTDTRLRVRTWFVEDIHGFSTGDNNDTMGDSFDLDLVFNMEQL